MLLPSGVHRCKWIEAFDGVWCAAHQSTPRGQTAVCEVWRSGRSSTQNRWAQVKQYRLVFIFHYISANLAFFVRFSLFLRFYSQLNLNNSPTVTTYNSKKCIRRGRPKQESIARIFTVVWTELFVIKLYLISFYGQTKCIKNPTKTFEKHNFPILIRFLSDYILKGVLHVSYAPEYETVADLREKIKGRRHDVRYRLRLSKKAETIDNKRAADDNDPEPSAKLPKIWIGNWKENVHHFVVKS